MFKQKSILFGAALLAAVGTAQAALVQMYNTDLTGTSLQNLSQARAIIAASSGPDFSVFDSTIHYSGDGFPGSAFGDPPDDRFVMRVTGTIDTSLYSSLSLVHDDGFVFFINGVTAFQYNGNTGRRTTASGPLANIGLANFEMIFWDQGGEQIAQLSGTNRSTGAVGLAQVGNPVSAPGSLALAGLGLALLGASLRRRTA